MLNHVLLHQTVIGEEALLQLAKVGETPDLIVGCTGGGSNFGGLAFPFLREKLAGRMSPAIRAVEPAACPSLTRGTYAYDFGDTAGMTPLMKMHTLGPRLRPGPDPRRRPALSRDEPADQPPLRGGADRGDREVAARVLRRRGAVRAHRRHRPRARADARASRPTIEEALRCKESGEAKVILTALCGHGHLDLPAYDAYLSGAMEDNALNDAAIDAAPRRCRRSRLASSS